MIAIAHSPEFEPDAIDVELGFLLLGLLPDATLQVGSRVLQVRELPAQQHMAVCVRVGLPEHAHLITAKIGRFFAANGFKLDGPGRDAFLHPPRADRMHESIVEMQFPVARADRST